MQQTHLKLFPAGFPESVPLLVLHSHSSLMRHTDRYMIIEDVHSTTSKPSAQFCDKLHSYYAIAIRLYKLVVNSEWENMFDPQTLNCITSLVFTNNQQMHILTVLLLHFTVPTF
jgi:hypothetical protein